MKRVGYITWISGGYGGSAGEVTLEGLTALGLVEGVHDVGGVRTDGVGVEARAAGLDWPAIHALAADIVYV